MKDILKNSCCGNPCKNYFRAQITHDNKTVKRIIYLNGGTVKESHAIDFSEKFLYNLRKILLRGCNGFDGDRWDLISEQRVSRTASVREKFALNIKADNDFAMAA